MLHSSLATMNLGAAIFLSVFLLNTVAVVVSPNDSSLSSRVLGTIATVCGQHPYHTPINAPYPSGDPTQAWIRGTEVVCLHDLAEVSRYCQRLYSSAEQSTVVPRAMSNPFTLAIKPPYSPSLLGAVQIYLCLGSVTPTSSNIATNLGLAEQTTSVPASHHMPSLIDIHRAYFEDKFRYLSNQTKTNVTKLIEQLRNSSKGLVSLYKTDPKLAQYSASRMLQDAHKRLEGIWTREASEWSRLEQARHEDLVKQLDSDDWAGENEFAYVLQEFTLDLNRVQDALSNLLNRLSESVREEIRHLRLVQTYQPWTLASNHTNWTNHITHEFTNIERVHDVLLRYVETATRAINTVRSLMIKNVPQTGPLRPHITYKPSVLASYNRLQSELFTAEAALSEAKQTLVANVTSRMHDLFDHMAAGQNQTAADEYVLDWLKSAHHSELAFIDLLVTRILDHPVSPSSEEYSANTLWRPAPETVTPRATDGMNSALQPLAHLALRTILIMAVVALVCLFATLVLLLVCLTVHNKPRTTTCGGRRQHSSLLSASGTTKTMRHTLKRWAHRTGLFGGRPTVAYTPTWKVERRVVVMAPNTNSAAASATRIPSMPESAAPPAKGYTNPIYPAC